MTTDSTVAKIGRSIKNREIIDTLSFRGSLCCTVRLRRSLGLPAKRRHRPPVRLDFHLCPHLLYGAHDDPIVWLDFALHHAEAVFLQGARLDAAGLGFILRVEDVNVLESLIGLNSPVDD